MTSSERAVASKDVSNGIYIMLVISERVNSKNLSRLA